MLPSCPHIQNYIQYAAQEIGGTPKWTEKRKIANYRALNELNRIKFVPMAWDVNSAAGPLAQQELLVISRPPDRQGV